MNKIKKIVTRKRKSIFKKNINIFCKYLLIKLMQ